MSTSSDASRPGSAAESVHDGASSHTETGSEPQSPIKAGTTAITETVKNSSILLAEDPFSSGESKLLFEAIDRLRSNGAGQELALPQLVIVGKQSVGKSSLLEALTEIPFPVGNGLCTRFATRIVSRRTPPDTPDMVDVSIEAGDINPFGESEGDGRTGSSKLKVQHPITAENFKDVLKQASQAMGIASRKRGAQKNFSGKVLKIELSGPNRSLFGILDLPGIFETSVGTVTDPERQGVEDMVVEYMRKPENIIIVVSDTDDLANQRILTLAAKHVLQKERIVGVITKCDLARKPEEIVKIVQNKQGTSGKPLHHGWFVVRNRRDEESSSSFDREEAEKSTFNKKPWLKIPESRRGTANLKHFLSELLCQRIREGFPGMLETMQTLLNDEVARLNAMGDPRPNLESQRAYLVSITQRFQTLALQALKSPEDLPSDEMNLRGKAQRAKSKFARVLRSQGHFYEFSDINPAIGEVQTNSNENSQQGRTLYDEIRTQVIAKQGEELQGMINPAVLKPLFKKQANKWPELAQNHLEDLADRTEQAVLYILGYACKEECVEAYTWQELKKYVEGFARDAREKAVRELRKLWDQETTLHLQTDNPGFTKNVKEAQLLRFKAALNRYTEKHRPGSFLQILSNEPHRLEEVPVWKSWAIISPETIDDLFKQMHSHTQKNREDEIHDLLKAYYEVAREDFISHVNRRIAEPFLYDNSGAVLGLSTEFIISLPEEKIHQLGGERESTIKDRKKAEATILRLQVAKDIAEQTLVETIGLGNLTL